MALFTDFGFKFSSCKKKAVKCANAKLPAQPPVYYASNACMLFYVQ